MDIIDDDALTNIFFNIPVGDFSRVCRVSKRWCNVMNNGLVVRHILYEQYMVGNFLN